MKAYLVTKVTFFLDNPRIDSFHYTMFHGLASRVAENDRRLASYMMGDDLRHPLHLVLNAFRMPEVIQPNLNLIVSETLARVLEKHANIALIPTVIEKIVSITYIDGDFRHWDDADYKDSGQEPEQILLSRPDISSLHSKIPNYYELVCNSYDNIAQQSFPEAVDIVTAIGPTEFDDPFEARLSEAMLRTFPVLWHTAGILFEEHAFLEIESHINRTYFQITEIDV